MLVTDISRKLNDNLHPLDLPLNRLIEILGIDFGKKKEVDRARINIGVRRDEFP